MDDVKADLEIIIQKVQKLKENLMKSCAQENLSWAASEEGEKNRNNILYLENCRQGILAAITSLDKTDLTNKDNDTI